MFRLVTSFLILLFSADVSAQKEYYKYRATLPGLTGNDSLQYEHALHNIPLLEKWMEEHALHYRAYYDLAIEYYNLSFYDTANKKTYGEKAAKLNHRYIELCPRRMKYHGYWNNAIVYSRLGRCKEALAALNISKELFRGRWIWWDFESEKKIRTNCK